MKYYSLIAALSFRIRNSSEAHTSIRRRTKQNERAQTFENEQGERTSLFNTGTDVPCPTTSSSPVQLIAGQNREVGKVWVSNDNDTNKTCVNVRFGDHSLKEVHIYYDCEPPTKDAPGRFPFHYDQHDYVGGPGIEKSWCFPTLECSKQPYIAFHAGSACPNNAMVNMTALKSPMPTDEGYLKFLTHNYETTHFDMEVKMYGNQADTHIYGSWCADSNQYVYVNTEYNQTEYDLYSIFDDRLIDVNDNARDSDAIINMTNLDKISWLINHVDVVTPTNNLASLEGTHDLNPERIVDWQTFQAALWYILENKNPNIANICNSINCDQAAKALVEKAHQFGDGYKPSQCDAKTGIMVVFLDNNGDMTLQEQLMEVPIRDISGACIDQVDTSSCETAWANFSNSDGSNIKSWGGSYCKYIAL